MNSYYTRGLYKLLILARTCCLARVWHEFSATSSCATVSSSLCSLVSSPTQLRIDVTYSSMPFCVRSSYTAVVEPPLLLPAPVLEPSSSSSTPSLLPEDVVDSTSEVDADSSSEQDVDVVSSESAVDIKYTILEWVLIYVAD